MSYIDGMASGLNTTEIIQQLMQVEAIPQTLLKQKANTVQAGLDAYASIRTKVAAVRTAADAIGSALSWQPLAATSSNSDAVTVTASTGTGTASGLTSFTVVALAKAMQQSSTDTFGSLDETLGGRAVSITKGGHTFDSTADTLGGLVQEINADDELGVRASTLQVAPGQYRLVLTAKETGVDNGFAVTSSGWSSDIAVSSAAQDAQLDVGGITVTRPSNTISDLIDGATLTLKAETAGPVTVDMARDTKAITDKVKALVDSVNAALGEIKTRMAYDPETQKRSSLTGDPTARGLAQSLTSALTAAVGASALGSVGLAGVELKRDGTVAFDATKFAAAMEKDPGAVQQLFLGGGSASDPTAMTFERASWRAQPGSYAVEVTNTGGVFSATIGGEAAEVTLNDDGTLRVSMATTHGRLGGMTVSVAAGAVPADGATGALGTIDYQPGAAKRLTTATNRALDTVDGHLTTAEESRKNRVRDINKQVEAWELRLEKRELGLRRQYTALETMMGQLANQGQWMSGQLAGLQANLSG